ncbi:DNA-formamidopyrimidine glycosylase [Candidatus Heimdallarchaeota archaeon B3_Heim]|nr:MAG: DNA-formamidopyrimidine glycosylase [Candidatus Heimdallarchaeota archaeon B3_Heim]
MPEGPEVESVRLELLQLTSQKVKKITLTPLSQKYPKYLGKEDEFSQFRGQELRNIHRFNKFLIWEFEKKPVILNHLGMSGRWTIVDTKEEISTKTTHPKVIVEMSKPPYAIFDDTRNFGQFRIFSSMEAVKLYPPIKKLGIDGLTKVFPLQDFVERIAEQRFQNRQIGDLLMDPRLVAGIGNIYKAEILFEAKIHPERIISTLTQEETVFLGKSISKILLKAFYDKGSSFDARYKLPSGEGGQAQRWHMVYQRIDQPCGECGSLIKKLIQKNRSTYFCPKCQH